MSFLKKTVLVAGLTAAWLPVVNAAGIREAVEKTVEWTRAYLDGEDMLQVMDGQIEEFFNGKA